MIQKQSPRSASHLAASAHQTTTRQQLTAKAPAAAPHTVVHHNQQQQWRLELFFKTQQDLHAQLPFLQRHGITRVNLTNKSNDDQLLQSAALLQANIAGLDLCVHYSLKYNYNRSPAATLSKLQTFHNELQQIFLQAEQEPAESSSQVQQQQQRCHVLLISGGGKKKAFDTVTALQQLSQQQQVCTASPAAHQSASKRQRTAAPASNATSSSSSSSLPSFAVAFNPYLPDEAAAAQEVSRLRAKLQTGLVGRVYLQVGCHVGMCCYNLLMFFVIGCGLFVWSVSAAAFDGLKAMGLWAKLQTGLVGCVYLQVNCPVGMCCKVAKLVSTMGCSLILSNVAADVCIEVKLGFRSKLQTGLVGRAYLQVSCHLLCRGGFADENPDQLWSKCTALAVHTWVLLLAFQLECCCFYVRSTQAVM
jgi:hypothetical protein